MYDQKVNKHTLPDIDKVQNVILLIIDGLGTNIWNEFAYKYPLFKTLINSNKVIQITSGFPSTTSAVLTSLQFGISPKAHGLIEWHLYLSQIDQIIESLPYKIIETNSQSKKSKLSQSKNFLFGRSTIYQKLKKRDVQSIVVIPKEYIGNYYHRSTMYGSLTIPYTSLTDMAKSIKQIINHKKGKTFSFVYLPHLDNVEHKFGPYSNQVNSQLKSIEKVLRKDFIEKTTINEKNKTVLILASDHGQIACDPSKIIYLNKFMWLFNSFKRSNNNYPILPRGNVRDIFLSIKDEELNDIYNRMSKNLSNIAGVYKITPKLENLLFSKSKPHVDFYNRIGNLLIIPYKNNVVWYRYENQQIFKKKGIHGGLSKDEMLVPYCAIKMSDI
jgi:predicted AlkP superfamily pyrophosphatase or phosphodiesterase